MLTRQLRESESEIEEGIQAVSARTRLSELSAVGYQSALSLVCAKTKTSVMHLDMWMCEGEGDKRTWIERVRIMSR